MEDELKISELANQIKELTNYVFKNACYLRTAFTQRRNNLDDLFINNEPFEFIGDKLIGEAIVKLLVQYFRLDDLNSKYRKLFQFKTKYNKYFKDQNFEGVLTNIEKNFTNGEYLTKCFQELNLNWTWLLEENELKQHDEQSPKVQERNFEALIGAIALDSNFDNEILIPIISKLLHFSEIMNNYYETHPDYVSKLQLWTNKHNSDKKYLNPIYNPKNGNKCESGCDAVCEVTIYVNNEILKSFTTTSNSYKTAKYNIAKIAYQYLEEHHYIESNEEDEINN